MRASSYLMCPPAHYPGLAALAPGVAAYHPAAFDDAARGFPLVGVDLSEFRKAGGGSKCCPL